MPDPTVIPAATHGITEKDISIEARKVISRLHAMGYAAYVVGGAVRDLLLGRHPKDFDVVTDAYPEQVKKIFRNSRIIGRRFKLVHIFFREDIIEVSTFRKNVDPSDDSDGRAVSGQSGVITRDNVYGTPKEDAWRRDFTVNALLWDPEDGSIIDYTGGMEDIEKRRIRSLGDPVRRYREDPVRMIRAVRFAAKLGFDIESETAEAIHAEREQMAHASNARMYDEIQKLFLAGCAEAVFDGLMKHGLMSELFPDLSRHLDTEEEHRRWVRKAAQQLDRWRGAGVEVTPELMFCLLFGYYHEHEARRATPGTHAPAGALGAAARDHMHKLGERIKIPRAVISHIAHIMSSRPRFERMKTRRMDAFKSRVYFHDAYIYFKFRSKFYGEYEREMKWWDRHL